MFMLVMIFTSFNQFSLVLKKLCKSYSHVRICDIFCDIFLQKLRGASLSSWQKLWLYWFVNKLLNLKHNLNGIEKVCLCPSTTVQNSSKIRSLGPEVEGWDLGHTFGHLARTVPKHVCPSSPPPLFPTGPHSHHCSLTRPEHTWTTWSMECDPYFYSHVFHLVMTLFNYFLVSAI